MPNTKAPLRKVFFILRAFKMEAPSLFSCIISISRIIAIAIKPISNIPKGIPILAY